MTSHRARGAVFTPEAVARRLAERALDGMAVPLTVCDPAAGDGRLLRAVADVVGERGGARPRCFGADLHQPEPPGLGADWAQADTLTRGPAAWVDAPPGGFDLVIGNPPFRGQLQRETALTAGERSALGGVLGTVAKGYADTAAVFLVAACQMAAPRGRVAFIMPLSFLTARDAGPARRRVLELASLEGLWIAPESVFPDADVRVCAVVLDRAGPRRRVIRRWVGADFDPLDPVIVDSDDLATRPTWGHLAAAVLDVPEVDIERPRRLGEIATATAGFRQQFYGLAPLVVEHPGGARTDAADGADGKADGPRGEHLGGARTDAACSDPAPLVTSGLIDPGRSAWGLRPARMAGTTWQRPAVDLGRLDPASALGRWVAERRRPKLLVATQTKVVEAAPDPAGSTIPSTPVVAVHVDGFDLWRALAVLLAPPVTAWARTRYSGAALSVDAVKLSASQVLEVPLPPDVARWDEVAAGHARAHAAGGIDREVLMWAGEHMTAAYRCDPAVTAWWASRLPS